MAAHVASAVWLGNERGLEAIAQSFDAFRAEPFNPFGHRLRGGFVQFSNRRLAQPAVNDCPHHWLSTSRRQQGILMAVHLVSPWNTEASQPQLPRFRPDGQPLESSHLASALVIFPANGTLATSARPILSVCNPKTAWLAIVSIAH
jgi:hypothetical protein